MHRFDALAMNTERPPYGTTVDNVQHLCEVARDLPPQSKEDLQDEVDDLDEITFERTLEAAVTLGLFEHAEDDGYRPTTTGRQLGYGGFSESEREEFFRERLVNYDFYDELLELVADRTTPTEDGEETYIDRDTVQRQMGVHFDLGMGDRILKSAAGTFLQFLEECGLGHYARSSSAGLPTRLVLNDEFDAFTTDSIDSAPPGASPETDDVDDDQQGAPTRGAAVESAGEPAGASNEELAALETVAAKDGVDVTVSIEISAGELSPDELRDLLETLRDRNP